ncbi:MAG TPA: hypothetical protein VGJ45_07300 [Pseudonocardiaceae bacterium]|jgi:hypothetical protein
MPDRRTFRTRCHDAARRTGGSVSEFRFADGVTPSFDQAVLDYGDRTVAIIRAHDSASYAIAVPRTDKHDSGPLTFLDEPALVAALTGARVLTKAELDSPFDPSRWPDVSTADVRYWKPTTLGEALFSYWD